MLSLFCGFGEICQIGCRVARNGRVLYIRMPITTLKVCLVRAENLYQGKDKSQGRHAICDTEVLECTPKLCLGVVAVRYGQPHNERIGKILTIATY